MQTDIPLKIVAEYCPADLLHLLGVEDTAVLAVESLELPASATRLDSLLRLRSAQGAIYLHLIEWQGYPDPLLLWRVLGYITWLALHRDERPILVTIVYLTSQADVGDVLRQELDGQEVQAVRFHVVRLWEQDAQAAFATGRVGLAVLSPLMRGATQELVSQAAQLVIREAPQDRQADLLSILGVFAEPLINPAQYVQMMGRERLMESKLLELLVQEKEAEMREREARREAEMGVREAQREESLRMTLKGAIEGVIIARFPSAPVAILKPIQDVQDTDRLTQILLGVSQAQDQDGLTHVLAGEAGA